MEQDEEDDFDATLRELGFRDDISKKMDDDLDYAFAVMLQSVEEDSAIYKERLKNESGSKNESKTASPKKPLSVVHEQWEIIDPNPNIQALFLEFNTAFFWGALESVEVRWSPRMTLCAGICCYEGRGGLCSVRLSQPLLKYRPRRDLVETLLHEMIHAYLFVTNNNKDHDGHGPEFLKHMNRINAETGARITVYHSFHDEVDFQRKHWWKCDGPCQRRSPYFGIVKRAMNRAPSARDPWWSAHLSSCGGTFTKIKQPENYGKKKPAKPKGSNFASSSKPPSGNLNNYFARKTPVLPKRKAPESSSNIHGFRDVPPSPSLPSLQNVEDTFQTNNGIVKTISSSPGKSKKFVPFSGKGFKLSDDEPCELSSLAELRFQNSQVMPEVKSQKRTSLLAKLKKDHESSPSSKFVKNGEGHRVSKPMGGTLVRNSGSKTVVLSKKTQAQEDNSKSEGSSAIGENTFPGNGFALEKTSSASESNSKLSVPSTSEGKQKSLDEFFPATPVHKKKRTVVVFSSDSEEDDDVQIVHESALSEKFNGQSSQTSSTDHPNNTSSESKVPCPVCGTTVNVSKINSHLDSCLKSS